MSQFRTPTKIPIPTTHTNQAKQTRRGTQPNNSSTTKKIKAVMRQSFAKTPHHHQKSFHHRWLASLDFYAKVPVDLLEGSQQGNILSWVALLVILMLMGRETIAFFSPTLVSDLQLDRSPALAMQQQARRQREREQAARSWHWLGGGGPTRPPPRVHPVDDMIDKIEVRFNITLMDLKCEVS